MNPGDYSYIIHNPHKKNTENRQNKQEQNNKDIETERQLGNKESNHKLLDLLHGPGVEQVLGCCLALASA